MILRRRKVLKVRAKAIFHFIKFIANITCMCTVAIITIITDYVHCIVKRYAFTFFLNVQIEFEFLISRGKLFQ